MWERYGRNKMIKLLPCPFCGKEVSDDNIYRDSDKIGYYVECPCQVHNKAWTKERAINEWNRRKNNIDMNYIYQGDIIAKSMREKFNIPKEEVCMHGLVKSKCPRMH
jgi:penicillin-binding protein-related factor A (putative recombinase)